MVRLISEKQDKIVEVPTSITEITADKLAKLLASVNLPEDYVIIGVCQKVKLSQFAIMTASKAKETLVYTLPIVAKLPEKHHYSGYIKSTDKVIVNRADLELGTTLNAKCSIGIGAVRNLIDNDEDLRNACYKKTIKDSNGNEDVDIYVIEFKIIPISSIKGTIPITAVINDPFSFSCKSCN